MNENNNNAESKNSPFSGSGGKSPLGDLGVERNKNADTKKSPSGDLGVTPPSGGSGGRWGNHQNQQTHQTLPHGKR
jgi:hypothetical protein